MSIAHPRLSFRFLVRAAAALLAALAPLCTTSRAGVLVVDASGGGEFTSLGQALAVAQDGDTVLVRPGSYGGLFSEVPIANKSLVVAGDGTGPVLTGPIKVFQSTPGKRVVLRNLQASAQASSAIFEGLNVQGGDVLAEDCTFQGHDGQVSIGGTPGSAGVRVESGSLVLVRCTATGGRGADTFFPYIRNGTRGGYGLQAFARASVYGCTLAGGDGGDFVGFGGAQGTGGTGGAGVVALDCAVLLAGTTAQGGDGGDGDLITGSPPDYAGGDGVTMLGVGDLRLQTATLAPGIGGQIAGGGTGATGDVIDAPSSPVTTYPGPYRSYALGPATPEGSAAQMDYAGVQGDLLLVFVALAPATAPLAGKQGVWHLGSPLFGGYLFGPVTAGDGTFSLAFPIPSGGFTPDVALLLYEQVFVKPAAGPALLSSPTTHLIVDDGL